MCFIDLKTPEILTLRNVTKDSAGWYKCTASNDAGEESCIVEVKLHCKYYAHARATIIIKGLTCTPSKTSSLFPHSYCKYNSQIPEIIL